MELYKFVRVEKASYQTQWGGGGGGCPWNFWWGCEAWFPTTGPMSDQNVIFGCCFSDLGTLVSGIHTRFCKSIPGSDQNG